jgi:dolichyl-phosphate beta-glucosyltransferase
MRLRGEILFALPSLDLTSDLDEFASQLHEVHANPTPVTADLDIVIPVLNEEMRIGKTIAEICRHLHDATFTRRLLIVDNGSVDATAEVIDATDLAGAQVELISCGQRGKGAAVRAGILHSTARLVGYCDADLSTPPSAINAGLALIADGWQAVIGSRRCEGSSYEVPQSLVRRAGSLVFNRAAASLVGSLRDTQCGFKLLDGDVARRVFRDVQLAGFAFDVELIARLIRANVSLVELPIQWTDDQDSTFSLVTDGAKAFRDLYLVRKVLARSFAVA